HVAEDLVHSARLQPQLHDLGECDVKHGSRLHVVNLYNGELGNPQVPTKFRQAVQKRRQALIAALILTAAASILAGGFLLLQRSHAPKLASAPPSAAPPLVAPQSVSQSAPAN